MPPHSGVHVPKLTKIGSPTEAAVTNADPHGDPSQNVVGLRHEFKSNAAAHVPPPKAMVERRNDIRYH